MTFTEKDVENYLLRIGIPASVLGFRFAKTAIVLANEENYVGKITVKLYPEIARRHNSTWQKVERGLRFAIAAAWDRGDFDFQCKVFQSTISPNRGVPSNSEFILRSVDYLNSLNDAELTFSAAPDSLKEEFLQLWAMYCKQKEISCSSEPVATL